jgi:hypothetical protein
MVPVEGWGEVSVPVEERGAVSVSVQEILRRSNTLQYN